MATYKELTGAVIRAHEAGNFGDAQALADMAKRAPDAPPPDTSRTFREAITDIPAALTKGAGAALKMPGSLIKLAPGLTSVGEALERPGEALSSFGESLESKGLKVKQALRSKAMSEAEKDGVLAEFVTAIKYTALDPALLTTFIAEQLPQLVGPGGAAKITTMLGKKGVEAAAEGTAREAAKKALGVKATSAALGTGAVMQGADIGSETYDAAMRLLEQQRPEMPLEERRSIALAKARMAAVEAGVISLATQRLPGAKAIEQRMAGVPGAGRIKSGLGEAFSEAVEEGGGKFVSNLGLNEIDPTLSLTKGIGTAAGLGSLGGGILGGALGARRDQEGSQPGVEGQAPIDAARQAKAQAAAERQAAKGQAPGPTTTLSPEDLFQLASSENGYGKLEQYYQTLKDPEKDGPKSPEVAQAFKEANELRREMNTDLMRRFMPARNDKVGTELGVVEPTVRKGSKITPEESTFAEATPDLLGEIVPPVDQQPEQQPVPVQQDFSTQDAIPGLETFPISHFEALGIPKSTAMVKKYGKEGTNAVDLNDAGQVSTLLTRINDWLDKSKDTKDSKLQNAREQLSTVPQILTQRLDILKQDTIQAEKDLAGHGTQATTEAQTATEQGLQNDTGTVTATGGESTSLSSQPSNESPTGGTTETQPTGVVPIEQDAGAINAGEGQQQGAVTLESVQTQLNTGMAEVAELSNQQQKLLTKAGRKPAEKSAARAKWDALDTEIDRKKTLLFPLLDQESALKRQQGAVTPAPAPAAPFKITPDSRILEDGEDLISLSHIAALDSKNKSASTRAKNPSFLPTPMLTNLKALIGLKDTKGIKPAAKQRIDNILNTQFTPEEVSAATNYKQADTRYNVAALNQAVPTSPAFEDAVAKGDVRKALQAVLNHPDSTAITKLVVKAILRAGTLPKLSVVPYKSLGVDPTNPDKIRAGVYDTVSDSIQLDAEFVNAPNLIHEVMHGFLHRKVVDYMNGTYKDAQIKRIDDLFQFLGANHPELSEQYGMTDLSEFVSEAMSNPEFQKAINNIPYKKGSFFSEFAKSVLKFFGINDTTPQWNALTEALISTEAVMQSGRRLQEARTGTAGPEAASNIVPGTQTEAIGEKQEVTSLDRARTGLGANVPIGIKVKAVDSLASTDNLFTKAYQGKVRDAQGNINPSILMARALDATRISLSVHLTGTLKRINGIFMADELTAPAQFNLIAGQKVSYKGTIDRLKEMAKARGVTFEVLKKQFDEVLYGHREYNLVEKNKQIEADAAVFLANSKAARARGDTKKADELLNKSNELLEMRYQPLLTPAKIAQREAEFNSTQDIREISQRLDAIRYDLIDQAVLADRISEEDAQDYKDATGYIPFDRIGDFANKFTSERTKSGRGVAVTTAMHHIHGVEDRKVASVIDSSSGLIDWFVGESIRNEASLRGLKDMALLGAAKRVPSIDAVPPDAPGKVIEVYEKGLKAYFHVADPSQVVAFSLNDPILSSTVLALQKAAQLLRAGVTVLPPFAFRQVAEDISRAYVYAGVKHPGQMTARILMNFPVEWFNELFGKKSNGTRELERMGVVGSFGFTPEKNVKNIMQEVGIEKKSLGSRILQVMEAGAKASDIAVRRAIYEQTMKETNGDAVLAEMRAREIINFSRRGSSKAIAQVVSAVPFFNAYAQSMGKLSTAIVGDKAGRSTSINRSVFYQRMGIMTAMGLTYALMMADDEDYWNLGDDVRDRNWILPYGKYLGFTPAIPIAPELGFIFKSIPERVVQYYKMHGTDEERKVLTVVGELVKRGIDVYSSPNLTPQLLKPFLENLTNHSFNLGRPLESQSQMGESPFKRYGMETSEVAKSAAEGLESLRNATGMNWFTVSPIKIENLIRGLTGTSAAIILQVGDAMLNPERTDRPLQKSLAAVMTGASAFMVDGVGTRYTEEAYKLNEDVSQIHKTINELLKTDPDRAIELYKNNKGYADAYPMVNGMMENVRELNKQMQMTSKLKIGSPAERAKANANFKELQQQLTSQVFKFRYMIDMRNAE